MLSSLTFQGSLHSAFSSVRSGQICQTLLEGESSNFCLSSPYKVIRRFEPFKLKESPPNFRLLWFRPVHYLHMHRFLIGSPWSSESHFCHRSSTSYNTSSAYKVICRFEPFKLKESPPKSRLLWFRPVQHLHMHRFLIECSWGSKTPCEWSSTPENYQTVQM